MGLSRLGENVITTQIAHVAGWARKNSLWPMAFGTACCAIELMATMASKYDAARFGAEVIRFSPRQSDLMIVSGRVTLKMMPVLRKIYEQMPEPKWVISMGACASCGGVFDTYTMIQGVDQFIPVDVYVPGCPPRPESVIDAIMKVQELVAKEGLRPRHPRALGPLARGHNPPYAHLELTSPGPASQVPTDPAAGRG